MTKHTPGPWDRHFETKECKQSRRKWRVDYITTTTRDHYSGHGLVNYIAEVNGQCDGDTSANARLIAAAPDLLAECLRAQDELSSAMRDGVGHFTPQMVKAWLAGVNAAIAKTKGA